MNDTARQAENLRRVGPGTVMGEFMRQYWMPAALSSELVADGDPMRLMLLGEKLIAFRDTAGRVGVMDHRCPHRCASLFLGRNEDHGIRCVYHGWKFDVEGRCVDMPNVRPEQQYCDKAPAKAYKVAERNGLIWVYMGKRAEPPPLPMIEATLASAEETEFRFVQRKCNWLQALEGDIDTSHFGFLHAGSARPEDFQTDHPMRHTVIDRAPEYEVIDTPWGTCYGAHRIDEDGRMSWRIANFMLPFWTQAPNADFDNHVGARAWVPMDDEHTMVLQVGWKRHNSVYSGMPLKNGKPIPGFKATIDFLPDDTGWYGRHRPRAQAENEYEIDREAQRRDEVYTGIQMIFMQDQAVTESMGPISDHGFEHLGPSDQMIARTRRRVFKAATALAEKGQPAPGTEDAGVFWGARSGSFHSEPADDWRRAYYVRLARATRVPIDDAPQVAAQA